MPRLRPAPALAALAIAAMFAVAVVVILSGRHEPSPPAQPKVVARLTPGGGLDQVIAGFGSAWLIDATNDTLVRMDPATRRVTARIQLHVGLAAAIGSDAVWVGERVNDVARIDPRTNRITARIRLPERLYPGGIPVPIGDSVWIVGSRGAGRIDARTNRVTETVTRTHFSGFPVPGAAVLGGDYWTVLGAEGLVRVDGRTGKPEAAFPLPFRGTPAVCGDALLLVGAQEVARVDPATGAVLWRSPANELGPCTTLRGLIWAEVPSKNGDRLVAIDPRTGRAVARVRVGESSAVSLERVGAELWLATADGKLVIVRP